MSAAEDSAPDLNEVARKLQAWGEQEGFSHLAVSRCEIDQDMAQLKRWLADGLHGEMGYLERNLDKRARPARLVEGTVTVISARMDYLAETPRDSRRALEDPQRAYVARYALGRDYHKVLRRALLRVARRLEDAVGPIGYRVFADSAPVLEKALARDASLGWIGKNTLLIDPERGSYFFLGEIFTDCPLPTSTQAPVRDHCGDCQACLRACPTDAILPGNRLDARRCISYLTIEQRGPIPPALRPAIGNRIFGCDDCQIFCPWNRHAKLAVDADFAVRHGLDSAGLIELFQWSEEDFDRRSRGMALRRAGYRGWLRNIAVALGNAPADPDIVAALEARRGDVDSLVREHIEWALARQRAGSVG